jgi:hypothetical protein
MLQRLGVLGAVGLLCIFGGLGIVTYFYWEVGVGLALVFLGTGLIVKSIISNVLSSMGMGGMI